MPMSSNANHPTVAPTSDHTPYRSSPKPCTNTGHITKATATEAAKPSQLHAALISSVRLSVLAAPRFSIVLCLSTQFPFISNLGGTAGAQPREPPT